MVFAVFSFNGSWFLLSEQPVSLPPPPSLMTCQRTPTVRCPRFYVPARQGCPSPQLKLLTAICINGSVVTGKEVAFREVQGPRRSW